MRYVHLLLISALLLMTSMVSLAQERDNTIPRVSPNSSVSYTAGITEITVTYGAPYMRHREIFGDLVPYGEVWRVGANEATVISFSTDVELVGLPVSSGDYALLAIPEENEWTIILNSVPNQWGAYQYDANRDVARFTVEAFSSVNIERLWFYFGESASEDGWDEIGLAMIWAGVGIEIPIRTHTDQQIVANAEQAAEAEDWARLTAYARHALTTDGRLVEDGLSWAQSAAVGNSNFGSLSTLAWLYAATGDTEQAITFGEQAIALVENRHAPPFGYTQLVAALEEWQDQ